MTQNSIPALIAMSSLQQTASSEQQAALTAHGLKVTHAKTSVSFTVLSANTDSLVLQDNANKQSFSLPSSSFTGDVRPSAGDTLLLVNANDRQLSFRLLSSTAATTGPMGQALTLPLTYNRALIESWPRINLSAVNKAPLIISAQLSIDKNDISMAALAKVLVQNAVKLGQPLIALPILAKVNAIVQANQGNISALVKLPLSDIGSKDINISLPISEKLKSAVQVGSKIEVVLTPNRKDASIQAVTIAKGIRFANVDIQAANRANPLLQQKVQQISQSILFNTANLNPNAQSNVTQTYVQAIDKAILNALPKSFSAHIKAHIPSAQLADTRLLISPAKPSLQGDSSSANNKQVTISVVQKPQLIQIVTQSVKPEHVARFLPDISVKPSVENSFERIPSTDAVNKNSINSAQKVIHADKGMAKDALLTQLTQRIPADAMRALSGKIQQALNHTLAHSEPTAPVINAVKTTLESILVSAQPETRALLKPLLRQINLMLAETMSNAPKPSGESGAVDNNQTAEKRALSSSELPDLLRANMSTQAVTQIAQNTQMPSQNSFIDGLVSLLKLSLATKLAFPANSQSLGKASEIAPNIAAFATQIIKQSQGKGDRASASRILHDIAASDSRGSLISDIGKLLSTHNTQKLRSAEASLQGQDTFFYSLPNIVNKEGEDIELVIKREKERAPQGNEAPNGYTWKLDMKLDAGKYGTVLAKTQFKMHAQGQGIDLHLYASSEALKARVIKYLPLLHQRLSGLGIQINSQTCDVGKVDSSLFTTQLNVMHTYA